MRPEGSLFPTAGRSPLPAWLLATGYVCGWAGLSVVVLLRQSGVPATKTVWAEDGRIFYSQATMSSFWHTLVTLHNGYVQLFPRLSVQLALLVPPADVAATLAITGAISLAGLACLVFHMAKGHIATPAVRTLLPVAMVLLPVANTELLNNLVNVPWWLFFAAFWALLWRPRSIAGLAGSAAVCFLAAASEPLVALFLPLAVARAVSVRSVAEQAPGAGLLLGLVYQALVIVPSGAKALSSPGGLQGIGQSFAIRAGLGLVGGVKGTNWLFLHDKDASVALGGVVVCLIVVIGALTRAPRVRTFALVAAGYSVACFVVPVWLRDVAEVVKVGQVQIAGRYQAVPLLLLASAVLVLADHFGREGAAPAFAWITTEKTTPRVIVTSWRGLAAVVLCLALFAPTWVTDFRQPNQRSAGPIWSTQVAKGVAQCRGRDHNGGTVAVPISPPHWTAKLECSVLTSSSVFAH
ncbi:MAG TPA: hypothetical protein VEJ84_01635 [Acidimicrobiales bacterium]|nr:hypothetical protein [Acidimicrobiales bacterium]